MSMITTSSRAISRDPGVLLFGFDARFTQVERAL